MVDRRFALLGLAAVGLAACGGSSSNSSGVSAFKSKVNSLCAGNNAKITALPASSAATIAGLRQLGAIAVSTLNQAEALKPPQSIAAKFNAYLSNIKKEA